MFSLKRSNGGERLTSQDAVMTSADFDSLARKLAVTPMKARKSGFVSARPATETLTVETRWNGKESSIKAEPGDMVVTNMTADREILRDAAGHANTYVIRAAKFPELYERSSGSNEFGDIYRARGVVEALFVPGGFEIMAPWGEMQRADAGYILKNGDEIYGNAKETFEKTYETVV